jgi:hypothetical protein
MLEDKLHSCCVIKGTDFSSSGWGRWEGKSVNGIIYREMLEFWLKSQLPENKPDAFQHGRVPPHIHNDLTRFLNQKIA